MFGAKRIKASILEDLDSVLEEKIINLMNDKKFMGKFATAMAKAEAKRLMKDTERRLEDFTQKELEMASSPDPWCDVMLIGTDPQKGEKLRFGWNPAMIKYLKDNGMFTNISDEEEVIQKYFGMLFTNSLLEDINDI